MLALDTQHNASPSVRAGSPSALPRIGIGIVYLHNGVPCRLEIVARPDRPQAREVVRRRVDWDRIHPLVRFCMWLFHIGVAHRKTLSDVDARDILQRHQLRLDRDGRQLSHLKEATDGEATDAAVATAVQMLIPHINEIRASARTIWQTQDAESAVRLCTEMLADLQARVDLLCSRDPEKIAMIWQKLSPLVTCVSNRDIEELGRAISVPASSSVETMNIDLTSIPVAIPALACVPRIAFGDMHGNCMLLLHVLVQTGFLRIESPQAWNELAQALKLTDSGNIQQPNPVPCDPARIATLLAAAVSVPASARTRMLDLAGDLLADRRDNVLAMLAILGFLDTEGIQYQVPISNHDEHCIFYYFNSRAKLATQEYEATGSGNSAAYVSLERAHVDLSRNPALRSEFATLMESYLRHLRLAVWNDDTKTLLTHGVVNDPLFQDACRLAALPCNDGDGYVCNEETVEALNRWFRATALAGNARTMTAFTRSVAWRYCSPEGIGPTTNSPTWGFLWNILHDPEITDVSQHDPYNTSHTLPRGASQVVHGHCEAPAARIPRRLKQQQADLVTLEWMESLHRVLSAPGTTRERAVAMLHPILYGTSPEDAALREHWRQFPDLAVRCLLAPVRSFAPETFPSLHRYAATLGDEEITHDAVTSLVRCLADPANGARPPALLSDQALLHALALQLEAARRVPAKDLAATFVQLLDKARRDAVYRFDLPTEDNSDKAVEEHLAQLGNFVSLEAEAGSSPDDVRFQRAIHVTRFQAPS